MTNRNNGKAAESAVQSALKSINLSCFDWQRFYDSTSARGIFMAQVGDFGFFLPGVHGIIEVKSTQHAYRLNKSAFSDGQRIKLAKRAQAGGKVWAVVWHHQENIWRAIPYDTLHKHFAEGNASYDCRPQSTFPTAAQAVAHLIEQSIGGSPTT